MESYHVPLIYQTPKETNYMHEDYVARIPVKSFFQPERAATLILQCVVG